MEQIINPAITISVDLKKSRIRIYRSMLRLLDEPRYIQLLVNPHNKYVAIKGLKRSVSGDQAEKIKPKNMMADNSYELYSKTFVRKLCDVAGNIEKNCSYRLVGSIVPSQNMAVFSLETLRKIEV